MDALRDTAWSFLILLAVFLPLELLFPANGRRVLHKEWFTDLLFFLGQYLLWTAPVVAVLTLVYRHTDALPLQSLRAGFAALPLWLSLPLAILLSDCAIYWGHRFSHSNALLWRFHRVHHTAEKVDWLAAHREHPFDNLYTRLIENAPLLLLGVPLQALAGFAMFRGLWAIFIHSNTRLSPGPLRYLLGAPRLHHWHHARELGGGVNYANLSPLMDLLFGTYCDPGRMPERYGIDEKVAHGYVRHLIDPLLPRKVNDSLR